MKGAQTIYVCPTECRFMAMQPGKCRSHPFPCRGMGPELVPLDVVPVDPETAITADEAENLFAAFAGGRVNGALLDSVTPKLEALAGKELVP